MYVYTAFIRLTTFKRIQDWLDQQLESRKSKLESVELEMSGTRSAGLLGVLDKSWDSSNRPLRISKKNNKF